MKKLILGIVCTSSLVALIVWLWTLQPQPKSVLPANDQNTQEAGVKNENSPYDPTDGSIVKTAKIKLKGKTQSVNFIVVSQNLSSQIIKADTNGSWGQDIELQKGLNLVKITSITPDLSKSEEQVLTYYFDTNIPATNVWAGSVKTIFDTLITLTTAGGEKPIRIGKSTAIGVPDEDNVESSQNAPLKQIRIGDWAVALGSPAGNEGESPLVAKITILRENKPKVDSLVIIAKTLNTVKANALTVKSRDKTVDLTLGKSTNVTIEGKTAKIADIAKDKNAIIVYHQEKDDNLVDLIYVLP